MNMTLFSRLSPRQRTALLSVWDMEDKKHNDKSSKLEFQVTNQSGIWRINSNGCVSVVVPSTCSINLTSDMFDHLRQLKTKNTSWVCMHACLDTSVPENWIAFSSEHVKRAKLNEKLFGGGSFFRIVPAKIVAAKLKFLQQTEKRKWWHMSRSLVKG